MGIFKLYTQVSKNHRALKNLLKYILQDEKTKPSACEVNGFYVHDEVTPDLVYDQFMHDKRRWNKMDGRQYVHATLSLHPDENLSDFEMLEIAREINQKIFGGHQVCYAIHRDRGHPHIHFVANSVSYRDGAKFHNSKRELVMFKNDVNKILKEHGLSICEKGKDFYGDDLDPYEPIAWDKNKYQLLKKNPVPKTPAETHVDIIKLLLLVVENLMYARSVADFIKRMKRQFWKVTWTETRKHITFESEKTGRKFRAANLEKTYGNKFREVFGPDFVLNKEHMTELLEMEPGYRLQAYDKAFQEMKAQYGIEDSMIDAKAAEIGKDKNATKTKSKSKKDEPKKEKFKAWEPPMY